MNYFLAFLFFFFLLLDMSPLLQENKHIKKNSTQSMAVSEKDSLQIQTGASRTLQYLDKLKGKKIGLVVNHTALIGNTHLVDSLLSLGLMVQKVFVPEHGFRGDADAGENVQNSKDSKTGIPLISLYGNQKKPGAEHLKDLDILIFDIQDVGARF